MAEHEANQLCASCHRLIDPIGFGLESFDAMGRLRQRETILIESATGNRKDDKKIDLNLDTNGEIAGIQNSGFSDAKRLGAVLAQSHVCQECIVRQIFRYAFGRMETSADEDTIHQLFVVFRDSGFHFQDVLVALVKAPQFTAGLEDNQNGVIQASGPSTNAAASKTGARR
jgi:hypothetical protein